MTREELILNIEKLKQKRTHLRSEERSLKSQEKYLSQQPVIAQKDLASNLGKVLPSKLVPTNVGSIKHILVPYWYEATFELGIDPVIDPNFRVEQNFQVTQESAFLLCSISRAYKDAGPAGFGAPLKLDIRDNQSTRQFNDFSIPLQSLGYKSEPTLLPVPLLLMPNASMRLTLSSWVTENQELVGNGYQEFVFGGYRVPVEDVGFLLDSMLV